MNKIRKLEAEIAKLKNKLIVAHECKGIDISVIDGQFIDNSCQCMNRTKHNWVSQFIESLDDEEELDEVS